MECSYSNKKKSEEKLFFLILFHFTVCSMGQFITLEFLTLRFCCNIHLGCSFTIIKAIPQPGGVSMSCCCLSLGQHVA